MKLVEHLSMRTPLLWVKTDEPGRIMDVVVNNAESSVFRLDALSGLITWDEERGRWVRVLIDEPDGTVTPTHDMGAALSHVLDAAGTLLVENAHQTAEALLGFFLSVVLRYRDAVKVDDSTRVPAQFILLSHKDEPPPEIARMTTKLHHELPDEETLEELLNHLRQKIKIGSSGEAITRAGLGLSETEFISTALLSSREEGEIEASFVNKRKLEILKQGGVLEVRTPKLGLEDLGGLDRAKDLIKRIDWLWSNPQEAEEFGLDPLRRLMLVGVPGTGKSMVCEAIANMLGLDLGKGGVSSSMSKWVGESESNMRRMFATLKRVAPIVFWIDEFGRDMSGGMSSGSVDGGTTDRVHGEFLTGLQELPDNVFLAAAANRIQDLPPEMTRADRFDRIMFVGFPTAYEREEIFRIHFGDLHPHYDITRLAQMTQFFTGAEIKALIREVRFMVATSEQRNPTTEEVLEHVPRVKGRIWVNHRDAIVAMYERALVEWDWASSGQEAEAEEVLRSARGVTQVATPAPSPVANKQKKGKKSVPQYTPKFE